MFAALSASLALGCSRSEQRQRTSAATPNAPSAEPATSPRSPFMKLARDAAAGALVHARAVSCEPTDGYFALRRAVASGKAWWRLAADEPSEVLLGPLRSNLEVGGQLGALDAALEAHDCNSAARARFQVEQALGLIAFALERSPPLRDAARPLGDMAFELGETLLGSSAETALSDAGVLADAAGTLDGLELGLRALHESARAASSPSAAYATEHLRRLQAELEAARRSGLRQRALLVLETGALGVELRRAARELGVRLNAPFAPRFQSASELVFEPVSALTLPAPRTAIEPRAAALGKRLFFDQRLSKDRKRSCASCHIPKFAFSDRRSRAESLLPDTPLRNTPTLLYAAAQAAQLWDGRVLTGRNQALRVIHSPAELGLDDVELERRLRADTLLSTAFAEAFTEGLTARTVARALAEYQSAELVPGTAPIDRFARGDVQALGPVELAGLDVFAGKGRCTRCHVPPLFGGTRPADFAVTVYAVLGTTADARGTKLDTDVGRYAITRDPSDRAAFKTPSLRNVALTAPYFHNGAFPTLESVVEFYDRGGGKGFGHDVPNQDPDVRPLRLDSAERAALLAFLRRSLTDSALPGR